MPAKKSVTKTNNSNLYAVLSYVLGGISGLIFALTQKEDQYVRFHAIQSLGLSVAYIILISSLGVFRMYMLTGIVGPAYFIFSIFLIIKAHNGEKYLIPVIGQPIQDLAKQIGL